MSLDFFILRLTLLTSTRFGRGSAVHDEYPFMDTRTVVLTLWAAVMLAACGHRPASGGCEYQTVHIAAVAPREFVGRVGTVEIRLSSARDGAQVESFPDSKLVIGRPGSSCEAEGGVWQRRGIFVAGDGRTVAAIESSGSNDVLVFLDTESCQRAGAIDVSNAHWHFDDHGVVIAPVGAATATPHVHGLEAACRPKR